MDGGHQIKLTGIYNTRDLGGYQTKDGRRIKKRRLIRSGELLKTTKEDQRILFEEYKVRKIIDFRTDLERKNKPDPEYPGVENIKNPILSAEILGMSTGSQNEGQAPIDLFVSHAAGLNGNPITYISKLYSDLSVNEFAIKQYSRFFQILLEGSQDGAILWHCSAGKDRVGIGTALLLVALGVDKETVIEDYLKSNLYLKDQTEALGKYVYEKTRSQETAKTAMILNGIAKEYLATAFDIMEKNYGSLNAYLDHAMGLNRDKLKQLQDQYLEAKTD